VGIAAFTELVEDAVASAEFGGTISIASRPRCGTTLSVHLPDTA